MSDSPQKKKPVRLPPCVVCAQPARLHCPPCKTSYCCFSCQKEDWNKGHKKDCKRLVEANAAAEAAAAAKAAEDEAATPPPSPKAKAAPPVVSGPEARSREDVERAKKATAAAAKEKKPSAEHEALLEARCPICFENWDVDGDRFVRACCYKRVCEDCFEKSGGCLLYTSPSPRDRG